jgi:ribosomal protein L11 methyltransferase
MAWMELSLDATHEAVDWVCTLLAETHYIEDIQITEYTVPQEFHSAEPGGESSEQVDWSFTICFYLPYNMRGRGRVEEIAALLTPLHRTGIATELQVAIVDQKTFPALASSPSIHRIGRFVVLTPDTPYDAEGEEIVLRLKTSLAFGSGLHPATMVSLRLLERHVLPRWHVLDLGSGSGILSVAIAKLGATVLALDNDPTAVEATQDAICRNGLEQQITAKAGSLGQGSDLGHWMNGRAIANTPAVQATSTFDLIVANIQARVHVALAKDFQRALRQTDAHSGLLITAGFTTDHEEMVVTALGAVGFEPVDCERLNEWVALAHRLA